MLKARWSANQTVFYCKKNRIIWMQWLHDSLIMLFIQQKKNL